VSDQERPLARSSGLKELEHEAREFLRANKVSLSTSSFFAREFDPRLHRFTAEPPLVESLTYVPTWTGMA
jgi:hypothetical protein